MYYGPLLIPSRLTHRKREKQFDNHLHVLGVYASPTNGPHPRGIAGMGGRHTSR